MWIKIATGAEDRSLRAPFFFYFLLFFRASFAASFCFSFQRAFSAAGQLAANRAARCSPCERSPFRRF